MTSPRKVLGYFASCTVMALVILSSTNLYGVAYADTPQNQLQSYSLTGDALKNNPFAAKILAEIQYSKQQIAQLEQDQKNKEMNAQLIAQQRQIASTLEQQALQVLQLKAQQNDSDNAYQRFLLTVPNNKTQNIFVGEFDFMKQRVAAGHQAMKQVLANGGSWEEAMAVFSQYAAIKRTEMVAVNQELNIENGFTNSTAQAAFDKNGMLPDDYVKTADEINHGKT